MSNSSDILQPGINIRPKIDVIGCKILLEKLYGLRCKNIQELNGYDDKNFKVYAEAKCDNNYIKKTCAHGYVLKIMNKLDSQKISFVEGQTDIMIFLDKNNIKCPRPVLNKKGDYYSLEKLVDEYHIVRLLEYIPGKILHEVPSNAHLFYDVGQYLANMDVVLKNYFHETYNTHRTLWMLDSLPELKQFMYVVTNKEDKNIIEDVIDEFERTVLTNMSCLEKSILHGDFNEQNIVVKLIDNSWKVDAVLDFGDTQYSCLLFELAVASAHMIVQSKDIDTAAYVIAGYKSVRPVPDNEFKLLKVCIAARFCQSVVMGLYSHIQHPDNKYVLTTQATGWKILRKFWFIPEEDLYEKWNTIIKNYNA